MERKTKRLWIRISAQDAELIKQKAANYKTVSSMIWDAIKQFDDTWKSHTNLTHPVKVF